MAVSTSSSHRHTIEYSCTRFILSRCMVLDELGDTSNEADRRKYFDQLDDDQSGAIDFEEYLEVRVRFLSVALNVCILVA